MAQDVEELLASADREPLSSLPTQRLRELRAAFEAHERGVSYVRRVLQGRVDILRAELGRRERRGDDAAESLLASLPTILGGDHVATDPLQARAAPVEVPDTAEPHQAELDRILDASGLHTLPERSTDEIRELIDLLAEQERVLSARRRELFDRVDAARDELAARYKDGRASISELLGSDGGAA